VSIVDVIDAFGYQEVNLTKKDFVTYIKTYLPKVKQHLETSGKADRVPTFQKGAAAFVKHIIEKFDEIQIYTGKSFDMEAGYTYCYYAEQTDAGPTFFYFLDGMREEKF
jgi:Translationally controlled tumour protein